MNASSLPLPKPKIADESSFIGEEGKNLIATIVAKMRHFWTATTAHSDRGIDGYIQLCRVEEGKRIATGFMIQVQSKATAREWPHETAESFVFTVDERDLRHWLMSNQPVILVVSRPSTDEAYWISIKDYFASFEAKKKRTIYFKKGLHRFSPESELALSQLATPATAGLRADPLPKIEAIESNILPVMNWPESIYTAKTRFRTVDGILKRTRKLGVYPGREWFPKSGQVFSFFPLDQQPWPKLTIGRAVDPIPTTDWAYADDISLRRDFVRLLNETMAGFLAARGLWRFRLAHRKVLYFFAPGSDSIERTERWGERDSERKVVQRVVAKKDRSRILCYRHHAIIPRFERLGGKYYLIAEPTYHFTIDGDREYALREEYLAGIKRLERHLSVRNNVRFWADVLTRGDLFQERKDLLTLGLPVRFSSTFGIHDADWLTNADADERENVGGEEDEKAKEIVAEGDQLSFAYEAGTAAGT
jgi:hypothetical protein